MTDYVSTAGWLPGYDATNWAAEDALPPAALYWLYNDADYAAPPEAFARFEAEGHPLATIAVMNTTVANEYDWESGNQDDPVPYALNMRKNYGYKGIVYANYGDAVTVLNQFAAASVSPPYFRLANWTGAPPAQVPNLGAGTVGIQYSDKGDGGQVDLSLVAPNYPVIGPKLGTVPTPPPAPAPVPSPSPDPGSWQYLATHNPYTPIAVDGAFGPASVKALQYVVGATVDGVFGPQTVAKLQSMLAVTVDGQIGPVTISALQGKVGASVDGNWGPRTSAHVQAALNAGALY